jgi:hypothetical protein
MMEYEFTRMGIVYLHLIACCIAIGSVITSDVAMAKQLFRGNSRETIAPGHFAQLQKIVYFALIALWVTGAVLVSLDAYMKGWGYFTNPKLQAKVLVVLLLTLNGFALHKFVMPSMEKAGTLLKLSFNQRLVAMFAGTVSGVSWLYAALLGIGRPLNFKYSLLEILAIYPVLLIGGFVGIALLVSWSQYKASGESRAFEATRMAYN